MKLINKNDFVKTFADERFQLTVYKKDTTDLEYRFIGIYPNKKEYDSKKPYHVVEISDSFDFITESMRDTNFEFMDEQYIYSLILHYAEKGLEILEEALWV
jgi:hypothetical protein